MTVIDEADTGVSAGSIGGVSEFIDRNSGRIMVLPAVLILLAFAIFPLIVSAYLALSRFSLAQGGFVLKFVGLLNFRKLLVGTQQYHLLGTLTAFGPLQWGLAGIAGILVLVL